MLSWEEYAAGWRDLHGGYDPRAGSPFVRGWLRIAYLVGRVAAGVGATPAVVTGVGVALSGCVPVLVWRAPGGPFLAAALVLLSAVADSIDGAVAVLTGRVSRLGQVYDGLADRISEACWLVALWLLGAPGWLLLGCGGLSWLHEYVRARAAAAGMSEVGVVTVAERPTRIILVVASLVVAGFLAATSFPAPTALPAATAVTVLAGVWALLAAVGFGQLLAAVRAKLR
jgi:CDP-diacylglycerol--glycerol-3-phosphate 3-phosphatidyltransferase